jgi:hypothetical protein
MKHQMDEGFDSLFIKKKKSGVKVFFFLFSFLILAFLSVYIYFTVSAVRDRMKLATEQAKNELPVDASMIDLMKEKAWIESRLKMAAGDSVGLSIDLTKHLIQLELKGVVVMSSKIREYSASGFFRKMDGNVYFAMFGSPLTIKKFESSIEKNPFKVVQAPKSAEEYEASITKKDSITKQNVFWTVVLDRGFELNIQGIDSLSEKQSGYKLGKGFEFERDLKNISQSIQHIVKLKKPVYTPEILISIPESEAKSILMALPQKAMITIRI